MINEAIIKIVNKGDLSYDEAYTVMNEIMSGQISPTQNAVFLAALSTKSARAETTDEIAGCAAAMRDHATKVETDMDLFEIVGTSGDNAHSFHHSGGQGEYEPSLCHWFWYLHPGAGKENGGSVRRGHRRLCHRQASGKTWQGCPGGDWDVCEIHER